MKNTEHRMFQHFEFTNGSNPYIAIRTDTFFYMVCKYFLTQTSKHGFKAYEERTANPEKLNREYKKAILREFAIEWQNAFDCFNYSYSDLAEWQAFFEEYGRRYGLIREFRENGII